MKKTVILLFSFSLFFLCSAYFFSHSVSSDISSNLLRLHVIGNSNSYEDQKLKYEVRDSLIKYMNCLNKNSNSKEESVKLLNEHISDFKNIATKTIINNGFDYDVSIDFGNFCFPTKNYGNVFLPCGNYDALKVTIGSGSGQNWWCVLFPPLCFIDSSLAISDESSDFLKNSLSEEDFSIISKDNTSAEIKFKIVELFNTFKNHN